MPELPEVEVTRGGLAPHIIGQQLKQVTIRYPRLRWPIPIELPAILRKQRLLALNRRGKYLLWEFPHGTMLLHLGMSGKLQIVHSKVPPGTHDHVEWQFTNGVCVRLHDPRRFGCVLWSPENIANHPLLAHLGLEPLTREFSANYLLDQARTKQQAIKPFLMNNKIVVGVGNIYATEALFAAKINPCLPAKNLTKTQAAEVVYSIKKILKKAIQRGGTTIRDFLSSHGQAGYFSLELAVYGRAGEPCYVCHTRLLSVDQAQRTTTYCPQCQKLPKGAAKLMK